MVSIEGWSVLAGLVAGALIQLSIDWARAQLAAGRTLQEAKFEIDYILEHKLILPLFSVSHNRTHYAARLA
jgi:hypothetical protein